MRFISGVRNTISFVLVSLFCQLTPAASLAAPPADKTLLARGDSAFPPFEYLDDQGHATGFNVDLLREVAAVMGLKLNVELGDWSEARHELEAGRIDIITGMFYSAERDSLVDYSAPFITVSYMAFARTNLKIDSLADLKGLRVIVQQDDIADDLVTRGAVADTVIRVNSPEQALRLLDAGGGDCAVISRIQGFYFIQRLGLEYIQPVGQPLARLNYCFAVREGNRDLLMKLNEGLALITTMDRFDRIYLKWFGSYEGGPLSSPLFRYMRYILLGFLVLIAASVVWNYSLRRQVALRTAELSRELAERQKSQKALHESEERFRRIAENARDIIFRMSLPDGRYEYLNPSAARISGYSLEEFYNTPKMIEKLIPPSQREPFQKTWQAMLAGNIPESIEFLIITRSGEERWIEQRNALIRDENGRPVALEGIATDITDRRKMEEERVRASKLESIGLLAGGIAHDFNNILTTVLGNISLARMIAGEESEMDRILQDGETATLRARDLTGQLLTFARGGAPVKRPLTLGRQIEESVRFALRGANVSFETRIAPDLRPVEGDPSQIGQVLDNLLINARQAMPNGGKVTVRAENCPPDVKKGPTGDRNGEAASYIRLSVEDAGEGIPEGNLDRIFDPYFTTRKGGTGLGLATSYSIVKRHGGWIEVASQPGKGSVFSVFLPASDAQPEPEEPQAVSGNPGRHRILVMDDEDSVRKVCTQMLERLDQKVTQAAEGAEALRLFEAARAAGEPFEMVIMDLTVPGGMGGQEMVMRLREMDTEVFTVVSSGYSSDPVLSNPAKWGFKAVVSKPYLLNDLRRLLLWMEKSTHGNGIAGQAG
ncbi:transporter substrate-binding domain-containing protein [bacterium]|nr:transporter substrate-binding domain-containing protein [bacterium]